jgi:hypothetical protein
MNRIRKYNNKYQVLITPSQPFNSSFELMMGTWTDDYINRFYVTEYETLGDAQCEAYKYPDIDWTVMVLNYKSAFTDKKEIIKQVLSDNEYIVDFEALYKTPEETKNAMFNRVLNHGCRFNLLYNMNDIIYFHIVNPWTKNCMEIADKLINETKLKILKKTITNGVIQLIGKTDLGTTYEIAVWPTLLMQWAKWRTKNPNVSSDTSQELFNNIVKQQAQFDSNDVIR